LIEASILASLDGIGNTGRLHDSPHDQIRIRTPPGIPPTISLDQIVVVKVGVMVVLMEKVNNKRLGRGEYQLERSRSFLDCLKQQAASELSHFITEQKGRETDNQESTSIMT
jgi:hypothetical protein